MKLNVLVICLFLLMGCELDDTAEANESASDSPQHTTDGFVVVEHTTISQGDLFGAGEEGIHKQNLVINDSSDWDSLTSQIHSANYHLKELTEIEVDFNAFQIIAVFDTIRPTNGYSIALSVLQNEELTRVDLSYQEPGEFVGGDVITQPYYIVKIPSSDLPIEFK